MVHATSLAVVLAAVWLAWSGHFTPLLLSLGAASVLGVVGLVRRMGALDAESVPLGLGWRTVPYLGWLFVEIVKANVDVALRVLTPGRSISPRVFRVPAGQRTDLGLVIYADSITLTPGTVTIAVEGETLVIHALSREAAAGLETGDMQRRVARIERHA